ncbi:MAG: type I-E CRISPR-associated endonuclease Cas1 [FCB group bacterium]|nr:type I-E CRISPR-associated endonuclease Cas1 [FCB group bacterium]
MRDLDFRSLPKLRDSLSFIYLEHSKIDKSSQSVAAYDQEGMTEIPASALTLLMLGPGTSITHEAVKTLADSGCMIVWCGEQGIRYYAHGIGETQKGYKIERQARLWADENCRMIVVRAMYTLRLGLEFDDQLTLEQLRGMEGVRVRKAYALAARETGVEWKGRNYDRHDWRGGNEVNRALSTANSCLYGICHCAIVSAGYSPALGFIHSGKQLSFVFDIADLYKAEITIPVAFKAAAAGAKNLESEVRHTCRDRFHQTRLLGRILPDIEKLFLCGEGKAVIKVSKEDQAEPPASQQWDEHLDPDKPLPYWQPESGNNHSGGGDGSADS